MSARRSTKRCAAAAAGFGMVVASFAGAAASATAAMHSTTHRHPVAARHITPDVPTPTAGVTASVGAPVDITEATAQAGTATTVPTVTITDPGVVATTDVITLALIYSPTGLGLTATVPTVTPTGAGVTVSAATVDTGAGTIKFTVTKTTPGTAATYTVSGAAVSGDPQTQNGAFGAVVEIGTTIDPTDFGTAGLSPFGAVSTILPAAAGETAPDTAAVLFRAQETVPANEHTVVLASDYEPQDAESANYLARAAETAILLTDPTTLSPAVSSVLHDYSIDTVYIVGGTSVVSAGIEAQLDADYGASHVIRLAGADQYATNQVVDDYILTSLDSSEDYTLDYTKTSLYNDTSGNESATTTSVGDVNTAIVVSGGSDSYQDGVVSGPLSYGENFPVILTSPTSLSDSAREQLTAGQFKQVIVIGGPSAVSDSVVNQLTASTQSGGAGVVVFRVAGQDASDTSTKLASFMLDSTGNTEIDDFDPYDNGPGPEGGVLIARGNGFQDALAAGPYAGGNGFTPILLTENATTLGAPLAAYLTALSADNDLFAVQAIGGPLSVTPGVQQAASDAQFAALSTLQ